MNIAKWITLSGSITYLLAVYLLAIYVHITFAILFVPPLAMGVSWISQHWDD